MLLDQRLELGHSSLLNLFLLRPTNVGGRANLVRESKCLRAKDSVLSADRDQVLLAAHHKSSDPNSFAVFHPLCEQSIRFFSLAARRSIITALERHRRP